MVRTHGRPRVGLASLRKRIVTTPGRSRNMSAVRGRGNQSTELAVARLLRSWKLAGWRRHEGILGRPDFLWKASRVALFVDGCFWHGCPRCYKAPRSNFAFWRAKIRGNRARDQRVTRELHRLGWTVLRVWECQVNSARFRKAIHATLAKGTPVRSPLPRQGSLPQ